MNKETLQLYNNRLEKNNVSLQDVLDEVNALSDTPIEKLYLIRNGIEQTDVTGGHKFIEITSDTNNSNYAEVQKDGWIELCGKQWGAYGWITNNSFDFTKYVKIYVEYDFPNAPPDTAYLEFSQSHIAIMTSEDLSGAIYDSGSILPARVLTVPRRIVRCDVNVNQTSNRWCISVSNITSRTDYKNYPLRIYNVWFETDGGILEEPELQNKTITPSETQQVVTPDSEFDGLSNVIVKPIPDEYIVPSGTLDITENGIQDVTNYAEVNINVEGTGGEPVVEPDYITDGLIAWWEGEDGFDENVQWHSRVGDDYITTGRAQVGTTTVGSSITENPPIYADGAVFNTGIYGFYTQQDYCVQDYTIQAVGRFEGNDTPNYGGMSILIGFNMSASPMIGINDKDSIQFSNGSNLVQGMTYDVLKKNFSASINLESAPPRGGASALRHLGSVNGSNWVTSTASNVTHTSKGNNMTVLCYYTDSYKSCGARIYSIRVYNRKLTHEELQYNYEIDKARFNITE